jgi:5-methylcytosine-specific restriction endonuclease McrBC GTP-binding regulatory subunit McrB
MAITNEKRHELYRRFQEKFPEESLSNMTLEQYTDINNEETFCYWLEHKTVELGSIRGGYAGKFGIYRCQNKPVDEKLENDEFYVWWKYYHKGKAEDAFELVRKYIKQMAELAREGKWKELDELRIDNVRLFGDTVKWKIAFMYSNEQLVPIFNKKDLQYIAEGMGKENANKATIPELQSFLIDKRNGKDIYEYADELWKMTKNKPDKYTFKELREAVKEKLDPNKGLSIVKEEDGERYFFVGTKDKLVGDEDCRYGVAARPYEKANRNKGYVYVEMYCQNKNTFQNYQQTIQKIDNVTGFEWDDSFSCRLDNDGWNMETTSKEDVAEAIVNELYRLDDVMHEKIREIRKKTLQTTVKYDAYCQLLLNNKNLILTGAPGTGKTYTAKQMAALIVSDNTKRWNALDTSERNQVGFVQFHPSFDYTDFVEGLRPDANGNFCRQDGIFKIFCKKALNDKEKKFVFIIDEINRGELSKIFGELFYSIEPDYRGEEGRVQTQYINMVEDDDAFKQGFFIPENVFIIGTMNDVDRGVETMDFAIRRRFAWREVTAAESADNMGLQGEARNRMSALNKQIEEKLGAAYCIGASYFKKYNVIGCEGLWNNHLYGIIYEYFRGERDVDRQVEEIKAAYFGTKTIVNAAPTSGEQDSADAQENVDNEKKDAE